MLRLTIKSLLDKKIRFALTTLAVVVGVTMIVAVFTMTDSLRDSFSGLAEDIAEGSDLTVRTGQTVGEEIDREPVPESLESVIAAVPGVARVDPGVAALNTVITDADGEAILPSGPPTFGFSWAPSQFFIIEGQEPTAPGEFAADATTAGDNNLVVGETYSITGPISQREFTLSGIFNFGSPDKHTSLGQTMSAFEMETAQEFLGLSGVYSSIGVVVDGNVPTVQSAIQDAIGRDFEVVTAEVIETEFNDNAGEFIDIFANVLLSFAFIIVFVSTFIVNNTFQIVVAQRIRELGLLRAIGATGRQVSRSVLFEALLVGIFSTITGIVLGFFFAGGLRALLNGLGFAFPTGDLSLAPRTIIWAAAVGIGVTFVSSIIPARRARTISPIAAIQSDQRLGGASLRRRLIIGSVLSGVGTFLLVIGLFVASSTSGTLTAVAVGAVLVFIGVNTLSPSFARPVAFWLGKPFARWFGIPGQIAQGNAARSPRRTASTAGALMIGLALVGMAGVVGASLGSSFRDTFDNSVEADYFIQPSNGGFDPSAAFSAEVVDKLAELSEIDTIVTYRFALSSISIEGSTKHIFTSDFDLVESHMNADIQSGSLSNADAATSIALHMDPAEDLGVEVGDTIDVTFPDNATETLTVAAIYADSTIFGNWMVDNVLWDRHFARSDIGFVSATIAGFSDDLPESEQTALLEAVGIAIEPIEKQYPNIKAENRVEFRQSQEEQLNSFLMVIFVLLALSLLIALIGIANTLALSVFERTREIGLLRAVGMSRRQLKRAIRWEAVIISVFGAILGLALGVVFGVAAVIAIPDTFIKTVSVPYGQLISFVIVAALAGVIAAILPARRAAKMDVLEAISHE